MLEAIARAVFGRLIKSRAAPARSGAGLGWKSWAIAGAVVLVLTLAAFAGGAWWASDRCTRSTRAAGADALAAAERRAAEAASLAEAARQRAENLERDAAAGAVAAREERAATAARISGAVQRVLAEGERCPIGAEFGGLWNDAVGPRSD